MPAGDEDDDDDEASMLPASARVTPRLFNGFCGSLDALCSPKPLPNPRPLAKNPTPLLPTPKPLASLTFGRSLQLIRAEASLLKLLGLDLRREAAEERRRA